MYVYISTQSDKQESMQYMLLFTCSINYPLTKQGHQLATAQLRYALFYTRCKMPHCSSTCNVKHPVFIPLPHGRHESSSFTGSYITLWIFVNELWEICRSFSNRREGSGENQGIVRIPIGPGQLSSEEFSLALSGQSVEKEIDIC